MALERRGKASVAFLSGGGFRGGNVAHGGDGGDFSRANVARLTRRGLRRYKTNGKASGVQQRDDDGIHMVPVARPDQRCAGVRTLFGQSRPADVPSSRTRLIPLPATRLRMSATDQAEPAAPTSVSANPMKIAVLGATGGVGFFILSALLRESTRRQMQLVALVRDVQKARGIFQQLDQSSQIDYRAVDTTSMPMQQLQSSLADIDVLVMATGTTAFPSKAWKGGNSPVRVDAEGVERVVAALPKDAVKRVVLLSSVGVLRKSSFPFSILNLFGVLDAKRRGEQALAAAARQNGFEYTVVRLGRLVGAPFTNVGAIRKDPDEAKSAVSLKLGDSLAGDLARSRAGEVVARSIFEPSAADKEFCAVDTEGAYPSSDEEWHELFEGLERPNEVLRIEYNSLNVAKMRTWLAQWSGAVLTSGALFPPLPEPVRFDPTESGCMLTFLDVTNGAVRPRGALNITLQEPTPSRKAAMVVFREPLLMDSPFRGERQILEQLKQDLANVSRYTPEA
ncbi:hypothetical protein FVE85_9006 [Porphyridium purpureum]|uniref:Uncharacterized protein n=1 Tax=Porphyridium purpureum TaxID=35688 RepID=A0A5J4YMV1_PORPP|nr:hypothetical protein FVE85_8219 [Porphyridium purpureum]KAA8492734.1 hypothetical protein FVE85_9006 [Porphyridium purpureum]|eukprot:POR1559..scf222_8